ncbi:hypothetical protein FA15DRAFT_95705 [Coprinopsis marcescibilis]|uniref:Uncharacterized protein n=1 Tax=Coprinopsis marcescibilis TaxID=230819 RepID=A0A5C3KMA1_COPMA|nr:hypothetical protein FA15DRAFT_95705 [Coprinopsis marcescibilis]
MSIFRQRTRSGGVKTDKPTIAHPASSTAEEASDRDTSTPAKTKLRFADVASMFIRLRRFSLRAGVRAPSKDGVEEPATEEADTEEPKTPTKPSVAKESSYASLGNGHSSSPTVISSPPTSPIRSKARKLSGGPYARSPKPLKAKPHHLVFSSGDEPSTHAGISEAIEQGFDPLPVEYWDTFECAGGVNLVTLLRATRSSLMEHVSQNLHIPANALVQEQWQATICGPKHGIYRVQIRYTGAATRSSKPDPRRPVALDQAKGIPGLMTILKRNEV